MELFLNYRKDVSAVGLKSFSTACTNKKEVIFMTYYVVVFVFVIVGVVLSTLIEMDAEVEKSNPKRTPYQIFMHNLILLGIVAPLIGIMLHQFM